MRNAGYANLRKKSTLMIPNRTDLRTTGWRENEASAETDLAGSWPGAVTRSRPPDDSLPPPGVSGGYSPPGGPSSVWRSSLLLPP